MIKRKEYTNKKSRNEFFHWLIHHYGYSKHDIVDNSRILSEKYEEFSNVRIPKITIYRWLRRFDRFISDEYQNEALNYIKESIIKIS